MIRSGEQFKDSIRGGRVVYVNVERVKDVTTHPQFKLLVDVRARNYDMQHEAETIGEMRSLYYVQDVLEFLESQKCQLKM